MKKAILIALAISLSSLTMAQSNAPKENVKGVSTYAPAPDKKFTITFSAAEFQFVAACAEYGFAPYVKTTALPINQLEQLQQSYQLLLKDKILQYRKQYVADSVITAGKSINTPPKINN